jgi:hypothetical protein
MQKVHAPDRHLSRAMIARSPLSSAPRGETEMNVALMPIHRTPDTGKPAKGHKSYPSLPGGLRVERPDRVRCADNTCLPVCRWFRHLVAWIWMDGRGTPP